MTATKELRRMLDERVVEYRVSATGYSIDIGPYTTAYANRSDTTLDVSLRQVTPEQAIAATLGAGTCKEVYLLMAIDIGDGREEVLGVYATEEAAMAAINENQFGYAFHHVLKQEVAE